MTPLASWSWIGDCCLHFSWLAAIALMPGLIAHLRRPVTCGVLLLALGLGLWPWWQSRTAPRAPTPQRVGLSVATVNLYDFNPDRSTALGTLRELRVDLLGLQEVLSADRPVLQSRWPYMVWSDERHLFSTALLSRHPIVWSMIHDLDGYALIDALVQEPSGLLRVYALHLASPKTPTAAGTRAHQLQRLAELVHESAEPVLVMGDFNLSSASPHWRAFVQQADVLRPAGATPGTWPAWLGLAGTDLDHIAGRGLAFAPLTSVVIPGSDHRGLLSSFTRH